MSFMITNTMTSLNKSLLSNYSNVCFVTAEKFINRPMILPVTRRSNRPYMHNMNLNYIK